MWTQARHWTADNAAGFNCCYTAVDHIRAFDEAFYLLMWLWLAQRGAQNIAKLPEVAEDFHDSVTIILVPDSKQGWASSLRQLISLLYRHLLKWTCHTFDLQGLGSRRLAVAHPPQPLVDLFEFVTHTIKGAAGRKLNSIECHDIMCKIGEAVVVGGVRRSAMTA